MNLVLKVDSHASQFTVSYLGLSILKVRTSMRLQIGGALFRVIQFAWHLPLRQCFFEFSEVRSVHAAQHSLSLDYRYLNQGFFIFMVELLLRLKATLARHVKLSDLLEVCFLVIVYLWKNSDAKLIVISVV